MDFSSQTPIYLQIAEDIRQRIIAGTLRGGDQVMSTTQYATTYRINPATANKGLTMLVEEGLLEKRRGIGMFIADDAHERLTSVRRAEYRDAILSPAISSGLLLGLTPDQLIDLVTQLVKDRP
ncbi:GntR family transcriptional regulator [Flaviflexus equikiangi]|uniref:GntR family transcriptional regulator n=1 Tax=Flaviflexus equikiangi TaxID=2758573 RepID=UPI002174D613|nr:GntR family transcriptional regulator [Flaviflexus equikiangi]